MTEMAFTEFLRTGRRPFCKYGLHYESDTRLGRYIGQRIMSCLLVIDGDVYGQRLLLLQRGAPIRACQNGDFRATNLHRHVLKACED